MMTATVLFLRDWTNSTGRTFPAGSSFSARGKNEERARANVARSTSTWIHEVDGARVLVPFLSREAVATFARTITPAETLAAQIVTVTKMAVRNARSYPHLTYEQALRVNGLGPKSPLATIPALMDAYRTTYEATQQERQVKP